MFAEVSLIAVVSLYFYVVVLSFYLELREEEEEDVQ